MKRGAPLQRRTPLQSRVELSTWAPLKRTAAKRKQAPTEESNNVRWRSEPYLAWVRTLPCCRCGGPGGDPHHVIGLHWGLSGTGLTAPDSFAMPTCRVCHQAIHRCPELQRLQSDWLRWTISRGVRRFDGEIRAELIRAWEFIDRKEAA